MLHILCCVKETIRLNILYSYSPVFSNNVFGVFGLLIMSISWDKIIGMYALVSDPKRRKNVIKELKIIGRVQVLEKYLPSFIAISPIAHVALLQTDMNSGFKFCPSIGINSAEQMNIIVRVIRTGQSIKYVNVLLTYTWENMLEAGFCKIS